MCNYQSIKYFNLHVIHMFFDMFTIHSWCRKYGLDDNTVDFIGHALALYKDDTYLDQPAIDFVKKVKVDYYFSHFVPFHLRFSVVVNND